MSWIYDLTRRPRRNFGYRFDAAMFVGREPTTISTYFFRDFGIEIGMSCFFLDQESTPRWSRVSLSLCIPPSSWLGRVSPNCETRRYRGNSVKAAARPAASVSLARARDLVFSRAFSISGWYRAPTDTPFCTLRLGSPARAVS